MKKKLEKIFLPIFVFLAIFSLSFLLYRESQARTTQTWNAVGSGASSTVYSFAEYNNELYVGGAFLTAGGDASPYIAKWNGTSWSGVGSGMNGTVTALAVYNNELYAGGSFSTAGGNTARSIAKWNGSSWSAVGNGFTAAVFALTVYNNELYAGGNFTVSAGNPGDFIAIWNGSSWTGINSQMDASVSSLKTLDNILYVAGSFTTAGGHVSNRTAEWDGSNWFAMGTGMNSGVSALEVFNNNIYAGGNFTTADGNPASHVARWNGSAWSAIGSTFNLSVSALQTYNNNLYAGGLFTTAGGSPGNYMAKYDGSSWSSVGTGMDNSVFSLGFFNDELFAGGTFTTAGGNPAAKIAFWFIDYVPPVTTASPSGGNYATDVDVRLSATDDTGIAATYYTTDGSTPTTSSTRYSSLIEIIRSTTLKFFSIDTLGNVETVKTENYILSGNNETIKAQRALRNGQKIYLGSEINSFTISGQSLDITFTYLPNKLTKNKKYWIRFQLYPSYPGQLQLGSRLALKKYWTFTTNLNKYKANNTIQKFKIRVAFKYSKKEFKLLKSRNIGIKQKDLAQKFRVKAGTRWNLINQLWKKAKVKHNIPQRKFTISYFRKFPQNTYYFGIIKR